jgi:hypothetical protein
MFAHVPGNGPGIGIESTSGGKTNDDTDRFTFKRGLSGVEGAAEKAQPD